MRTSHVVRAAVIASTAFALSTAAPSPALAGNAVHERGHEVGDVLLPPEEAPANATFCGFRDVPAHFDIKFNEHENTRPGSAYPYFAGQQVATWTWTNPDTGLSFTQHNVGQSRDQSVTDNGDGTLTVVNRVSGMQRVYGPDGALIYKDNGSIVYTIIVATNGTLDPEDDEFLGLAAPPVVHGPHPTEGRDFCADFLSYTSADQ